MALLFTKGQRSAILLIVSSIVQHCSCQTTTTDNTTLANASITLDDEYKCKSGLFLPRWEPSENIPLSDRVSRAIVYFLSLGYMFLGVSIIAERFMSSIEVITAKERKVRITRPTGETMTIHVKIWNETVSNLTLMALGSSAPEIMLTALEIIGNDFTAGDLGPGTIVGSAAFNLFIIIAICIYVIPNGEVRRIKHLRVFFVTATWSIVAYLWLYLMISSISPGVIQIWEGVVTLLLFPVTVLTAYFADKYLITLAPSRMYRPSRHRKVMIEAEEETDLEMAAHNRNAITLHAERPQASKLDVTNPEEVGLLTAGNDSDVESLNVMLGEGQTLTQEILTFEEHRKEYIDILRELRKNNPTMTMKAMEERAQAEVLSRGPKSRAFYRIQATRRLTGAGGSFQKLRMEKSKSKGNDEQESKLTTVMFYPAHYTVMESIGKFTVTVKRDGPNLQNVVYVDYRTEDGTANAGSDYSFAQGTLIFQPGETQKTITLNIIDDDVFEEDEYFYVRLGNLQYSTSTSGQKIPASSDKGLVLGTPAVATIMVLDDDHAGIVHFEDEAHETPESVGDCHVLVRRSTGARGVIKVPYRTIDSTAKAGTDYTAIEGELIFEDNEFEKYIAISIKDSETYQKNMSFFLEIEEPVLIQSCRGSIVMEDVKPARDPNDMSEEDRITEMGKPRLGDLTKIEVVITESEQFRKTVDKMLDKGNDGLLLGTSSWAEQFRQAVTVSAACESSYGELGREDDESNEEGQEDKKPSCGDYVMHYLCLFWKLLFATVPPTDYGSGWWCFVISILWIGVLTGIIGDIARSFGCTIRLKDSVTSISFVALGTSIPDTFASKVAAIGDRYADSSIGNVTGSNAVNVFLGIGVAWTMAAIVNAVRGKPFTMKAGSLAFSLTIFCAFAISAIVLLLVRTKIAGGELGGPAHIKIMSSMYLVLLWLLYLTLSSLEAYGIIKGF